MKHLWSLSTCVVLGLVCVGGNIATVHGAEKNDNAPANGTDDIRFFNEKVRPVLAQNCYKCHTSEAMGGLRLDSQQSVLKGGESGPAIVPKDPENSLLIQAVRQTGDLKMPPKGNKLRESEISDLVEWVKRGGAWDENESAKPVVATLTAAQAKGSPGDDFFENKVRPIFATQCGSCHQERIRRWTADLLGRVSAEGRRLRSGNRSRRSGEKPLDPGSPSDGCAEDAEGRKALAG